MAYVNVAEWKPEQVTEWLKGLDNSILTYVHSFLNNEVNGQQLLNIRPDDLDHLGVQKLGHQELILEAVEHLRNFHYELDRENLQLLALRLSCRARSLYKELLYQADSEPVSTQTLADVASIITTVKPIACWLGRSPFAGHFDYHHRKMELLNLSLEIATCAHRDRFAERPVEEIRRSCDKLASLADNIIQDIQDPLLLQPASLDLATVKKRAGDDLGFFIQPSFHGIHQISELKFSSPAQQCGKIEEGDEVVQVNYQTVVGWQSKKVMFLLEESPTDVFLTLKKRPRHTKVYGQIYIKPYRLPSKKRATPYTRWHENLPSPRPELLTIPDFEIPLPRSLPKQGVTEPQAVQLSDSEPLASSSSSGDDDEDDGAFLPGVTDLAQASPTSMRLYLPKQRSSVQRRATVTGASPTSRRPPVNIEQLWRELQLQHQWRGSGHNQSPNMSSEICQLRDKSHGISSSLMSMNDVLRPTTCLGIEQSMKNSFHVGKQKYLKEKNFISSAVIENRKETNKFVDIHPFKDLSFIEENRVSNTKYDKTEVNSEKNDKYCFKVNNIPGVDKSCSTEPKMNDNSENNCLKLSKEYSDSGSGFKDERTCSPGSNSCSTVSSMFSYPHETTKDQTSDVNTEENKEYILDSNKDTALRESRTEKVHQFPIDENALKIPYGKMKYIDDTSDTNLSKEFVDEYEVQTFIEDTEIGIRTLPNLTKLKESQVIRNVSDGMHSFLDNSLYKSSEFACSELTNEIHEVKQRASELPSSNASNIYHSVDVGLLPMESSREDLKPNQSSMLEMTTFSVAHQPEKSSTLDLPQKSNQTKPFINVKNKVEAKRLPNSSGPGCDGNNISNNYSFGYRNKLAQSLGQFGSNRSTPSSMCSPKTLKRRNMLLAKRRNVNLKDLGQADCEGWLLHRCRWSGTGASLGTTWTRAWFVLKGSIFYGFKSPHASKANIMISLPGFTASMAEEVKSKKFAFKVYHTGTVFYFAAESEQLLTLWLESIASGTVIQDTGKAFCSEDAFFSETDEDSDHETGKDTGTCFPNPRTYKFSNFLGGSSSPIASRSQQNLSSETKIGHEVQKKFGSLKKLGRKVTDTSGNSNSGHSDGGNSSSLDRKYLCFLGSSRNSTVPVPTAHFRSYRRVPNSSPNKILLDSSQKNNEPLLKGTASGSCTSNRFLDSSKEHPRKSSGIGNIRSVESAESSKQTQEKVRSTNYNNMVLAPNSNLSKNNDKETHPVPNKPPISDRFLRPVKIGELRDRSTHASNPTLQLSGDLSDYRLAAERLREFNVQRNRSREDTSGFVTLEEFMLSRQEEERKSEVIRHKILNEKAELYQSIELNPKCNEVTRHSSFNCINSYKGSDITKETCNREPSCGSENGVATPLKYADSRWTSNQLKSVAQYQPPPVAQLDDNQPLTMAFEMHLGEKEGSNTKTSKFRSIFASKSNRHHNQKPNQLEVPSSTVSDPRQKTLLGSPRLHRAIFRDKHHAGSKGSSSDSNSNNSPISSPVSPLYASPNEWGVENTTEICLSQTKPTMGISMLGKRPTRRAPVLYSQAPSPPVTVSTPDYPGLEYPPVFEPETYTLADASSLRSRPRVQADKHTL